MKISGVIENEHVSNETSISDLDLSKNKIYLSKTIDSAIFDTLLNNNQQNNQQSSKQNSKQNKYVSNEKIKLNNNFDKHENMINYYDKKLIIEYSNDYSKNNDYHINNTIFINKFSNIHIKKNDSYRIRKKQHKFYRKY